jgi:acyl-CoA thioesterase
MIDIRPGYCKLSCNIKQDMLNGFAILHGGVSYSIADSALAFASNAHNQKAFSVETSISHIKKVMEGDVLTAECRELNLSARFGIYEVVVTNQRQEKVALFKGTVYRTAEKWIE